MLNIIIIGGTIMLTGLCLLVGGAALYNLMKGEAMDDEIIYGIDDSIMYNDTEEDYEKLTYDYFMGLTIEEQEQYFSENLDLKYWKHDACKGFTDDRWLNAKHAADIARIEGKKFTNKYKTY